MIIRCKCGNCSLDLVVKHEECRCCMEIQAWVLEHAALGLKTKGRAGTMLLCFVRDKRLEQSKICIDVSIF